MKKQESPGFSRGEQVNVCYDEKVLGSNAPKKQVLRRGCNLPEPASWIGADGDELAPRG